MTRDLKPGEFGLMATLRHEELMEESQKTIALLRAALTEAVETMDSIRGWIWKPNEDVFVDSLKRCEKVLEETKP